MRSGLRRNCAYVFGAQQPPRNQVLRRCPHFFNVVVAAGVAFCN